MLYRLYQPSDFEPLYAIEEICFQPPLRFPRSYMRSIIRNSDSATWIAEESEHASKHMAGFAHVEWAGPDHDRYAYIQTLEVSPEHRRRGVARELLTHLEQSALAAGAAAIWLHVDTENAPAIRLYQAHGYSQQSREEHYYARLRAAFIYSKPLVTSH
ncbi:GNAT family N-acetyltransferase [Occallatibacter riparius]|uniref:GNAT family N-acetyltransferase n=1 Tax=Occallatibacter riparius TaxID=1002689 RepID=A0A9J7BLP1_9BACT|nr:N-acetyltransferase [Occallatibacter riparius]UWZ83571.1 GNAT family N-acetyltransferase [Occallatibacter riparius]